MNVIEYLVGSAENNGELLKMILSDFSDADMLVRPVSGANHAAWQLGHIIGGENMMVSACGGAMPPLPAGFNEKFTKETAKLDNPAAFPKKDQLLELFSQQRQATIAWIRTLSADALDKPGPESMRQYAPTIGAVIGLLGTHTTMHVGQFQVSRRKLGKPVMF